MNTELNAKYRTNISLLIRVFYPVIHVFLRVSISVVDNFFSFLDDGADSHSRVAPAMKVNPAIPSSDEIQHGADLRGGHLLCAGQVADVLPLGKVGDRDLAIFVREQTPRLKQAPRPSGRGDAPEVGSFSEKPTPPADPESARSDGC